MVVLAKGLRLPYIGIFLLFSGLFLLSRTLGLWEQFPFLYSTETFLFLSSFLFFLFYLLSARTQGYLVTGLIILSLAGTTYLPRQVKLPPFLDQTLFFHLLSLAFVLVFIFHTRTFQEKKRRNWPFYPAAILFGTGVLIYLLDTEILPVAILQRFDLLWPFALIIVGLYLVLNYLARRG